MKKTIVKGLVFGLALLANTVNASELYWQTKTVEVKVGPQGSAVATFADAFNKILVVRTVEDCSYFTEPEIKIIPGAGTCYDVDCSGGAGRSEDWDAFYSAKKEDKANKLDKAIKGIGPASSEALVKGDYFHSKPRSWAAFKTQINKAAADKAITPAVATLVLSTYRADNMAKLGYASGSCTEKPFACDDIIVLRESQYVSQSCEKKEEHIVDTKAVSYTFQVQNAVLLPSETETLKVTVSGNPSDVSVQAGYYNGYQTSVVSDTGSQVTVAINGVGRKQVALPTSALQTVALTKADTSTANLQITVGAIAVPVDGSESLAAEYVVKTCAIGLFGVCGIGWDKEEKYTATLTDLSTVLKVPVTIKPGRKGVRMEVDVKVSKQNSIYHTPSPVTKTTEKLTLK